MVAFILYNWPSRQNRFRIFRIVCQRVAQELESLKVFTDTNVQQANCGQNFAVLWRELQTLKIDFDSTLVVLLDLKHATKLDISAFVFVDHVSLGEVCDCFVVDSQEFEAQTFIEVNFPVLRLQVQAFVEDLDGGFVSTNQVKRTAELF